MNDEEDRCEKGGPEVPELVNSESPPINRGRIVDDVEAAAVNYIDVYLRSLEMNSKNEKQYDFIVCGSGSSGSVAARRLAQTLTSTSCY